MRIEVIAGRRLRLFGVESGYLAWQTDQGAGPNRWDVLDSAGAWVDCYPTEEEIAEYYRRNPELKAIT